MPNMKAIITSHNQKLLKKENSLQSKPCNCKNKHLPTKKILPEAILSFIEQTYLMERQKTT